MQDIKDKTKRVVRKAEIKKILRPLNEYVKANFQDNYYKKTHALKQSTLESQQKPAKLKKVRINDRLTTTPLCSSRLLETNENENGNKIGQTQKESIKQKGATQVINQITEGPVDFSFIADPRLSQLFNQVTTNGNEPLASRKIADIIHKVSTESLLREQTDQRAGVIKEGLRERRKYLISKLLGYPYF